MEMDKKDSRNQRQRNEFAQRKPLREVVAEVDQEILRLLVRRHNLLAKIRKNGHLEAAEEKYLREAWQNDVARVSRDPNLSGRFFALMQQISFLPKPAANTPDADAAAEQRRQVFNLAPAAGEINFDLVAPVSGQQTCAWLYLAAASGHAMRLENCLQNDAIVDCIRCLVEMGGAVSREEDGKIVARAVQPIGAPDKVIHVGASEFLFYLFLAHYLGRPGRVKFSGSDQLTLTNFSVLSKIVPMLGGRITFTIPKNAALPARLESPGMIPKSFKATSDLPTLFAVALLLAAPFYEQPFALNLSEYQQKAEVLARIVPIYKACNVNFTQQAGVVSVIPGSITIPERPRLPMEPGVAAFLLALPTVRGGKAKLEGFWPEWPECNAAWQACAYAGWRREKTEIMADCHEPIAEYAPGNVQASPEWLFPLMAGLAACTTIMGGNAVLPRGMVGDADTEDFFTHLGLKCDANGKVAHGDKYQGLAWNAPTPAWAMALALAACSRKTGAGIPLGNPGIVTELWPHFWSFYNKLPNPQLKKASEEQKTEKCRRRIITRAVAVPPAITEDDWD